MQKAIIIQNVDRQLNERELNDWLAQGWRVVSACPFGCSVAERGEYNHTTIMAAILVVIEEPYR